ncbi:MAG: hypothetical protein ABI634_02735 [Acidobacteriota bacterium]
MGDTFQVFDVAQDVGMFATVTYCALLAKACEEQGIEPFITVSSPHYRSLRLGPNWFRYFFGHKRLQISDDDLETLRTEGRVLTIRDRGGINLFARGVIDCEITNDLDAFSEATRLFDKYFAVHPAILERVDAFAGAHLTAGPVLGIHFRGTDHHREYAVVDYGAVTSAVDRYFPDHESVFLTTDEAAFVDFARAHLPGRRIVTPRATVQPQHRVDQGDNYNKGLDALTDCLLLSRCQALVKTPSALSAWAKAFNPSMEVVLVGKPYQNPWKHVVPWVNLTGLGYFPESLLYRWDAETMAVNRVLAILAEPPA